jgi:HPt (histidine-containing phosphotransfer) domain-containing protein
MTASGISPIVRLRKWMRRRARIARLEDEIAALIPDYLANRRADVRSLRIALAAEEYATIATLGHRMKGSGASFGLPRVSKIGQRLEDAGHHEDEAKARKAIEELDKLVESLDQPTSASSSASTRSR